MILGYGSGFFLSSGVLGSILSRIRKRRESLLAKDGELCLGDEVGFCCSATVMLNSVITSTAACLAPLFSQS